MRSGTISEISYTNREYKLQWSVGKGMLAKLGRSFTRRYSKYPVLPSDVDIGSEAFAENAAKMQALVRALEQDVQKISLGGEEDARKRHLSRGKLLPRDRIEHLLDPGHCSILKP